MVPWSYDQGKTADAGRLKADRSDHRTGGCQSAASSRNPDIDQLGQNKSRLILLNKADLADERQNEAWKEYFQSKGFYVVKVDSRNGAGMKTIQNVIQEACKEKIERDRRRGIKTVRSVPWWQVSQM